MKKISELELGFNDAENYLRKENKNLFNSIFVRDYYLDQLLQPSNYFLIGEKGTGKTAYSVFLSNNIYEENVSILKYIRETDYQKFITLKRKKHLELSDYTSIWLVIILLLLAKSINKDELDHFVFSKSAKIKLLLNAIDDYYMQAFSPEIISVLNFVENSKVAAEIITKHLKLGGEETVSGTFQESRFQVNLMYIQKQFENAISSLKLKNHHLLFIDGIDIRPGLIPYEEYLECVKGLANAVWNINNDFFSKIRDSKGRFKVVLLLRPDIFNSIGLQNLTNKIKDNSVYLDWRTTYSDYRSSRLFELTDKLLRVQQSTKNMEQGQAWDSYFPWKSPSTNIIYNQEFEPPFYKFLRLSYSRPRDIVTMLQILQEETIRRNHGITRCYEENVFDSYEFQNKYSEYLMGGVKDQLSFYYNEADYGMFLKFFSFLDGKDQFDYPFYIETYNKFTEFVLNNHDEIPQFVENPEAFLQFLYNTNIICYIEDTEKGPFFRWCYRERSPSNISPKVSQEVRYEIHYGLRKSLNLGKRRRVKN